MYPLHLETTIAYAGWVMTPLQRYSSHNGQGFYFILYSAVYQDDLAGPFVSQPPKLLSMYQKLVVRPSIMQKWAPRNQMS